jgi:hypothetical protein
MLIAAVAVTILPGCGDNEPLIALRKACTSDLDMQFTLEDA